MIVSQRREGSGPQAAQSDTNPLVEAMTWLRLQLEWEDVLTRLRRRAGLLPVSGAHTAHAPAA